MILHQIGDLFANTEKGYIIHGCNAQGVMGSGFAAQVKMYFPQAFDVYKASGHSLGTNSYLPIGDEAMLVNAVTQDHYGRDGKRYTDYDAVRHCFAALRKYADEHPEIPRIVSFPLIGCGLGGGEWGVIKCIIENELGDDFVKILWTLTADNPC